MDKLVKALDVHCTSFNRIYDDIYRHIDEPDRDLFAIQGSFRVLEQKAQALIEVNQRILDYMLDDDSAEIDVDSEIEKADTYHQKFETLKFKIEHLLRRESVVELASQSTSSNAKRKLKLPKIELKKFSGDIKDWLNFWSQFKRIHEDDEIENEDKFQYLIQSTVPKSPARSIVESYPPTSENYAKAVESLKSRCGRKDLLVEVYVRELIKLIFQNLNNKCSLSKLYDKLETQLRALESLDVTSDTCAALLYPLIESCLPEDILRVWQRDREFSSEDLLKIRLKKLMIFLKREVENEVKISMATAAFDFHKMKKTETLRETALVPTSSGLFNKTVPKCIFCKKDHSSQVCDEALKLTLAERKEKLSKKGCCHLCLKFGHIARRCRSASKLECKKCKGKHCTLMCPKFETVLSKNATSGPAATENLSNAVGEVNDSSSSSIENLSNQTFNKVFLQTLIIQVINKNKMKKIRAIIDTGSERSFISKKLAEELEFEELTTECLNHGLFGGYISENISHSCYRIVARSLDDSYACSFEVLDQTIICANIISIKQGPWTNELKDLGIRLTDVIDGPIEILIGADIAGRLFTGQKHVLDCGLVAMETLLGWTLLGKLKNFNSPTMMVTSLFFRDNCITDLWNLDILGITDPVSQKSQKEKEEEIMQNFLKSVTKDSFGRYEVSLPWIDGHPPLPDNFASAKRRLDSLMKKLEKDGFYDEYNHVFEEWRAEEIIEYIPEGEIGEEAYYLPHRHVVKLSSTTTKLRPVFDASSKEKYSPSLNQCLEKGLNLISLIPSILIKFRLCKFGVVSDIRKAFLQIGLHKNERKFLRFLWYNKEGHLVYFRHARVVFGITSSPFLLGAVIKHHLEEALKHSSDGYKDVIKRLLSSFYVDNCVTRLNNEEDLKIFIEKATEVMAEGKFDLRLWESTIYKDSLDENIHASVLGLVWNRKSDMIQLSLEGLKNINLEKITKKVILSIANRIFDPIGFAAPALLYPKIILQKTWNLHLGWDSLVPKDIKQTFLLWVQDLPSLNELMIPRWLLSQQLELGNNSLHLFCDSSKEAYSAAIFLKSEIAGHVTTNLVLAKSRVCPLKMLTIPRAELMAATILARLLSTILDILNIQDLPIFCWTDSSTVLSWIKRTDKWKTFVWNRVQEIRQLTDKDTWHHIPTKMNPADLPSRGCSVRKLVESRWWEGPAWLRQDFSCWLEQPYEVVEEFVFAERTPNVTTLFSIKEDKAWYYRYFSKYQKIVNLLGWIYRFFNNCRAKDNKRHGLLDVEERENAELAVIRLIQQETFSSIADERLASLVPFLDDAGVIRLKTKITERAETCYFRFPAVLPSKHPVVSRLIFDVHVKHCHVGVQGLLSIVRETFWILGGRKSIRAVVHSCITCRRHHSKSVGSIPVPLPRDRVKDAAVFEVTGVDMAGPLFLRNEGKAWICIFTCAVYRAIHLELVSSLSTETFLQALRRFIARRGRPSIIYSDNGKNFIGTGNAFAKLDWEKINKYSLTEKILWKLNPPLSAWWGGWWERLIGLVKQLLRKVLGRACLNYEDLLTVLCDCEAILNTRPLTYVSEDASDLVPLTPAMFLSDIKEVGVPDVDHVDGNSLNRRRRHRMKLKTDLRKRFRREYLGQLLLRSQNCKKRSIKLGDIVLVGNDNSKRLDWPLARIIEIIPGKDEEIRLVRVKTAEGSMLRSVQRVFPLEVESIEGNAQLN